MALCASEASSIVGAAGRGTAEKLVHQITQNQSGPLDPAVLPFGDPAIQFGAAGFFETLRVEHGRPHLLGAHLAQLERAAKLWGLRIPCNRDRLAEVIAAELSAHPGEHQRLRLTLGPDPSAESLPDGLASSRLFVAASVLPFDYYLPIPDRRPCRVTVFRDYVLHSADPLRGYKSAQYYLFWEARRRAIARGNFDALLLNERGELTEASAFNIFWIAGGVLHTPAHECGRLPGIFGGYVIELARSLGIEVRAAREGPSALDSAEAVFLTNSLGEIIRVNRIDDREFPPPSAGSLFHTMCRETEARRREREEA